MKDYRYTVRFDEHYGEAIKEMAANLDITVAKYIRMAAKYAVDNNIMAANNAVQNGVMAAKPKKKKATPPPVKKSPEPHMQEINFSKGEQAKMYYMNKLHKTMSEINEFWSRGSLSVNKWKSETGR